MAPKPVPLAAPNVLAPNDGVAVAVPNLFVDCVAAAAPNKPYTVQHAETTHPHKCNTQLRVWLLYTHTNTAITNITKPSLA